MDTEFDYYEPEGIALFDEDYQDPIKRALNLAAHDIQMTASQRVAFEHYRKYLDLPATLDAMDWRDEMLTELSAIVDKPLELGREFAHYVDVATWWQLIIDGDVYRVLDA